MRVQILKDFVKQHFPATPLLDYALEVEKITTSKKPNLILNVDGFIGVAMVDLLRNCGAFTREEADEYVEIGALNGIFVLGRSMGFIGKFIISFLLDDPFRRHKIAGVTFAMLPPHYYLGFRLLERSKEALVYKGLWKSRLCSGFI
ncbi:ATP-citrate synthase-like [Chiloscyllium plagiosum]|uniref:ATP-citrate synthase-like n=1 Tax=Chiloscyllium plagiosum TaxID=36176 RepID=UPI001CB7F346|nr:ATP-citrate synthase-like [Chiloscyllium plagiosum]XP_043558863.1 ATP-citrate synthase-like [Chiloscyllium plagiosum]XP_043564529.1 ATP-citrate synthase-like [Chiloscyllium plagiosum]